MSDGAEIPRDAIVVNDALFIPRGEVETRATRSGGPGGQHVNTSSTRIEVRWNVERSGALDDAQRERLREVLASRLDREGWLRIVASDSRSQLQNRERAEERLAGIVRRALLVPKARRATRPSKAAKRARLDSKKKQSRKKSERKRPGDTEW